MVDPILIREEDLKTPPSNKEEMKLVEKARKKAVNDSRVTFIIMIVLYIITFQEARNLFVDEFISKNDIISTILFVFLSITFTVYLIKMIKSTKNSSGFIKIGYVVYKYDIRINTTKKDYIIDIAFEDNTTYMGQKISRKEYRKLSLRDPIALVSFDNNSIQAVLIDS